MGRAASNPLGSASRCRAARYQDSALRPVRQRLGHFRLPRSLRSAPVQFAEECNGGQRHLRQLSPEDAFGEWRSAFIALVCCFAGKTHSGVHLSPRKVPVCRPRSKKKSVSTASGPQYTSYVCQSIRLATLSLPHSKPVRAIRELVNVRQ